MWGLGRFRVLVCFLWGNYYFQILGCFLCESARFCMVGILCLGWFCFDYFGLAFYTFLLCLYAYARVFVGELLNLVGLVSL